MKKRLHRLRAFQRRKNRKRPFIARMVETSLAEVDAGVVEAAQSMGASTCQIIRKVYLPEAKPSLVLGGAISIVTIWATPPLPVP